MTYIIGHRGAAGLELENSLASFQKAVEVGVDYIENDIRQLKDGTFIILHDHLVDRVTDGEGRIYDYTYEQLQHLSLKNGQKIMTVKQYLERVVDKPVKTVFELKTNVDASRIIDLIRKYLPYDKYIVWSFFHDKIQTLGKYDTNIQLGILIDGALCNIGEYINTFHCDIVSLCYDEVTPETVEEIVARGKKVAFWTVNKELDIQDALEYNPWGIVSNHPERVKRFIASK